MASFIASSLKEGFVFIAFLLFSVLDTFILINFLTVKMNEDRVTKLHYNVNIQYNRGGTSHRLTSPAMFSECMAKPLIQVPSEWDVLISKFKIDTQSIPLTIVKLQEYQPVRSDGKFNTDYFVYLEDGGMLYTARCEFKPEHDVHASPVVMKMNSAGEVKYNNCSETFFVWSYQYFLDMINDAIMDVCHQAELDAYTPGLYYHLAHEKICVEYSETFSQASIF